MEFMIQEKYSCIPLAICAMAARLAKDIFAWWSATAKGGISLKEILDFYKKEAETSKTVTRLLFN